MKARHGVCVKGNKAGIESTSPTNEVVECVKWGISVGQRRKHSNDNIKHDPRVGGHTQH